VLRPGTREWLFAMRAYYAGDTEVIALCEELELAWDKIDRLEKGPKQIGTTEPTGEEQDDEWSTGG